MFILKKIGCRIFQIGFRAALPILPYREPKVVSSCEALGEVFAKEGTRGVLIVTDAGIVQNGLVAPLERVLKQNGIPYTVYGETQPNPTVKNVEAALSLYLQNNCDTLIAIGGGYMAELPVEHAVKFYEGRIAEVFTHSGSFKKNFIELIELILSGELSNEV